MARLPRGRGGKKAADRGPLHPGNRYAKVLFYNLYYQPTKHFLKSTLREFMIIFTCPYRWSNTVFSFRYLRAAFEDETLSPGEVPELIAESKCDYQGQSSIFLSLEILFISQ